MTGPVWRVGCPVPLSKLRAIEARHVTFQGTAADGILVLHRAHAPRALRVLRTLYEARFPIRRMHPIERYGGSDNRSIEADNTSGFNCRAVTGGTRWSEHAYGRALDINPIENPYISGGRTSHPRSRAYLDRTRVRPGMAVSGSIAVTAFAAEGFRWGGLWTTPSTPNTSPPAAANGRPPALAPYSAAGDTMVAMRSLALIASPS